MEEIIIDGVNVSGCGNINGFYECLKYSHRQPIMHDDIYTYDKCSDHNNCIYKQLKRKEAECETLMEEKTKLNLIIDRLLKAGGYSEDTCNPYDFEEVYQDLEYKRNQFEEYKQALEKIEEKCQKHIDFCKDNKKNCELCSLEPCDDILTLQIIKECKE